jgi:tetraacyldisaccharide 4'-kinase
MRIDAWLQQIWYAGRAAPWWLRALSPVYGAIVRLRQWLYARGIFRTVRVGVPVIVIGNITVGGTGKTPMVVWLAGRLSALGLRVAVVSRGYGRVGSGVALVEPASRAEDVGDEALLISRRAPCPVYVGRDRVAAARAAVAAGAQLLIADDGLQHLRLARAMEIAMIDAQRGLGNGALLPAGPLREPAARLATVGAVVLTGAGTRDRRFAGAVPMRLEGAMVQPVNAAGLGRALREFSGSRVHAIAAIGNPARFFATLRAAGIELIEHPYPDHDPFKLAELQFGDGLPVIMTEKDAVKCLAFAPAQCWYLPVAAVFDPADERQLLGRILMDARLLDILACPLCKGPLLLGNDASGKVLVCRADRLAYPVRDDIPVMLQEEARLLESDDPLLER